MDRNDVIKTLTEHRQQIVRFGVKSLHLFGSVARDEGRDESDVDLLVEFREEQSFSSYMQVRIFLEDILGTKVDLVTRTGLRERVRPYVEKDAIRVA